MIYLCGITDKNQYQNIKELTDPIWEHVDGLIFGYDGCEGDSALFEDKCYSLLRERMGNGGIIARPWTNDHDLQMNTFLREGPMKEGDWFILRDSMERFNPEWAQNIKQFIASYDVSGVKSIYNYGKGFAFKWNDSMVFQGSPHWGLHGAQGAAVDLKSRHDESKKEWTWRVQDGESGGRPVDNKINHEAKYAWVYGRSNHLLLGFEEDIDAFRRAEMIRLTVRDDAKRKGFATDNLDGLSAYIEFLEANDQSVLITFINSHRVWRNYYRYHFVGQEFSVVEALEEDKINF